MLAKLQTHWVKTVKIGASGGMGLHFGGVGVNLDVLLAHEPLNTHVNPLMRTSTPRCARQPLDAHVGDAAHAQVIGLTCGISGPGAGHRVNVRVRETRCEMAGPDMASGPACV